MSDTYSRAAAVTAGFGAALASMGTADAGIVGLTATPNGPVSFATITLDTEGGADVGSIFVSATLSSSVFGGYSTPTGGGGSTYIPPFTSVLFSSFRAFGSGSNPLDNVQWVGNTATGTATPGGVGNNGTAGGPGTQYFIFQEGPNVGWFAINFTDFDGQFVGGAINDMAGPIRVGQLDDDPVSDVPLPATLPLAALGTLALGAAGLRRRRSDRGSAA